MSIMLPPIDEARKAVADSRAAKMDAYRSSFPAAEEKLKQTCVDYIQRAIETNRVSMAVDVSGYPQEVLESVRKWVAAQRYSVREDFCGGHYLVIGF